MRISDWSSDVCSSDLGSSGAPPFLLPAQGCVRAQPRARPPQARQCRYSATLRHVWKEAQGSCPNHLRIRSEEHTSELQSLMRISYAVFCLKKKINRDHREHDIP